MSERWLEYDDAIDIVRTRLQTTIGRAQAILADARTSREVRFNNPADPILLMADDGIVGMNLRLGRTNVYGIDAAGRPILHRTSQGPVELLSISEDDFLDWLMRKHPVPHAVDEAKTRVGAPEQYDWDDIEQFVRREIDRRGDFIKPEHKQPGWRSQNDLIEVITNYLERRKEPVPGPTRFKEKVAAILAKVRSELAAGH